MKPLSDWLFCHADLSDEQKKLRRSASCGLTFLLPERVDLLRDLEELEAGDVDLKPVFRDDFQQQIATWKKR